MYLSDNQVGSLISRAACVLMVILVFFCTIQAGSTITITNKDEIESSTFAFGDTASVHFVASVQVRIIWLSPDSGKTWYDVIDYNGFPQSTSTPSIGSFKKTDVESPVIIPILQKYSGFIGVVDESQYGLVEFNVTDGFILLLTDYPTPLGWDYALNPDYGNRAMVSFRIDQSGVAGNYNHRQNPGIARRQDNRISVIYPPMTISYGISLFLVNGQHISTKPAQPGGGIIDMNMQASGLTIARTTRTNTPQISTQIINLR
ncbi:MAG: hypothetical protein GF398_17165 [Chitinivibrionales bacterium]|nr:hypothetical protein [Chitinivibrionales bacterium]